MEVFLPVLATDVSIGNVPLWVKPGFLMAYMFRLEPTCHVSNRGWAHCFLFLIFFYLFLCGGWGGWGLIFSSPSRVAFPLLLSIVLQEA